MSAAWPAVREHTRQRLRILLYLCLLAASVGIRTHGDVAQAANASGVSALTEQPYFWGLIKDDGTHLTDERAAGIGVKVIRISWKDFYPHEGIPDPTYIAATQGQFDRLRAAGFGIILELGIQDTPSWLHAAYPDASYVDQYEDVYSGNGQPDSGDANTIFNPTVRTLIAHYMHDVFTAFGTDFYAVRLGGGHWGELTYPTASYNGHTNCYWAYDANARAQSPTPGWVPGQNSPHGEAAAFANWYLNGLVNYQNWQITTLRQNYGGPIMMLYPGWGIRPGQLDQAVAGNLSGLTSPEINGEVQTGTDYARQIAAITDTNTIVYTTWLDAPFGDDTSVDPANWRPVHYLASLAAAHHPILRVAGENTGQGSPSQMRFAVAQMKAYGLAGMVWYQEPELYSGQYATIGDYRDTIAAAVPIASPSAPSLPSSGPNQPTVTNTPAVTTTGSLGGTPTAPAIPRSSTPAAMATGVPTAMASTPSATATSTTHPSAALPTASPSATQSPSRTPSATQSPSRTPSATSTSPSAPTQSPPPVTALARTDTPVPSTATALIPPITTPIDATSTAPAIPGSTPTTLARPIATPSDITRPAVSVTPTATSTYIPTRHKKGRGKRNGQATSASRGTGLPMMFERTSASAAIVAPGKVETFTSVVKAGQPIHNVVVDFAVYDAASRLVWHSQRHHVTFPRFVATRVSIVWRVPRSQLQGAYVLKLSVLDMLPTRIGSNHAAIFRIAPPHESATI